MGYPSLERRTVSTIPGVLYVITHLDFGVVITVYFQLYRYLTDSITYFILNGGSESAELCAQDNHGKKYQGLRGGWPRELILADFRNPYTPFTV